MRALRSTEVLVALVIVILFLLLGWFDYRRQTRAVERFDTFSSYDFQHGGYRAWYDVLNREGIRVTRYQRRPAYLNYSISTLIIANNVFDLGLRAQVGQQIGTYTQSDFDKLRKWVESGGRLVWLIDQATGVSTPSEAVSHAARKLLGAETAPSLHIPGVSRNGPEKDAAMSIATSSLTDGVRSLSGTSRLRMPFDSNPGVTPLIVDHAGAVVGWYNLGKGAVVVVTDETLFENSRLNKADNARLAYNVATQGLRPGDTVAFEEWSHGYQTGDTWWTIMPWQLQVALGIAGGALLLLLIGATWRFGPAAQLLENNERTSQEYLVSMASLLDRGRARRKAMADLAQIALRAAARSVGMPETSPASLIATRLRGSETGDRRAHDLLTLERLSGFQDPSAAELVQAARLSRNIRKELTFDGLHHIQPRRSATRRSA
jgi:uncharacterized protein DUF4350